MSSFWEGKKVFVTGAFGFLGSWLSAELVSRKADVVALMLDSIPDSNLFRSGAAEKVSIVKGDLVDYEGMLRVFNEFEIEYCFHLGAQPIVTVANRNPLSTFNSNIRGTWNILEAARNSKLLKGLVVASSDKVYGDNEKLPYREDFPLNASHPYDVSKTCADVLSQSYFRTYGVPVGIARSGNFYGGGDINFDRLVPGTIKSLLKNEPPVIRSDGTFVRDYFYVKDAVGAFLALGENVQKKEITGQAFNFGTENHYTVLEIVEKLIALSGKKLKPKILNQASNEIRAQYLDCSKAKRLLNWKSSTSLDAGLKETFKWYSDFFASKCQNSTIF